MKQYLVFMCPRCRRFTNAPLGQKRRICSYCGKIIDISKAATALFDDAHAAADAVKRFNAGKDHDFDEAVRQSREKILQLMPRERVSISSLDDGTHDSPLPSGKTSRLLMMLERMAGEKACRLDEIETACKRYGLDWDWVEPQLEKLYRAGTIFYPHPWLVKYLGEAVEKPKGPTVDISGEILAYLREQGRKVLVKELYARYAERGVSEESVDASLERLMRKNEIYQPLPNYVQAL